MDDYSTKPVYALQESWADLNVLATYFHEFDYLPLHTNKSASPFRVSQQSKNINENSLNRFMDKGRGTLGQGVSIDTPAFWRKKIYL